MARARCVVAEAEIALVSRDLTWPVKALYAARGTLAAHGDRINAAHAHNLAIRRLVLVGHSSGGARLGKYRPGPLPPASHAAYEMVVAAILMRQLKIAAAQAALQRAERAARRAGFRPCSPKSSIRCARCVRRRRD